MTAKIQWSEEYSVGLSVLDDDHKMLFNLANHCFNAVEGRHALAIRDVFKELGKHVYSHFEREEQMMEKCGYGGMKEHKGKHEKLCDVLNDRANDKRFVDSLEEREPL